MPGPGALPHLRPAHPRASRRLGRTERDRTPTGAPPAGRARWVNDRLSVRTTSATMVLPTTEETAVIEDRLSELGIELPPAVAPIASYVPVHVAGDTAYVAGQVPLEDGDAGARREGRGRRCRSRTRRTRRGDARCRGSPRSAERARLARSRRRDRARSTCSSRRPRGSRISRRSRNGASDVLVGDLRRGGQARSRLGRRQRAPARRPRRGRDRRARHLGGRRPRGHVPRANRRSPARRVSPAPVQVLDQRDRELP